MGMENLFGVGLFQAVNHGDYFFKLDGRLLVTINSCQFLENLAYLLIFFGFYFYGAFKKIEKNDYASMLFIFTLSMYTFLTGYNEWSFWLPLAMSYLISKSNLFPAHIRRIK